MPSSRALCTKFSIQNFGTPTMPMVRFLLHLQAMAAALGREFLRPTPPEVGLGFVAAAGLIAWSLIVFLRRPLLCLGGLIVITGAYLGATRLFYDKSGLLLLTVPVLSALLLSGLFSLGFEYALERLEKLRTRRTLERYVSKNLVKEVLENPDSYYSSLRGARVPVTILFSDLVGFTTLSERADPEALVAQLNEYLTRMTSVVFSNGECAQFWHGAGRKKLRARGAGDAARVTTAQRKMAR
ncbi:MAG: hypothetical protein DME75_03040 [Verrucomicrobia bacterium]|nr:MAG: hypothetical protein DME75_03040 [Verrucomicrobiota bacterium]